MQEHQSVYLMKVKYLYYQLDNFAAYNTNGNSTQTHSIKLKWIEEPGDANLVDWVTYDSSNTVAFEGVTSIPQKTQRLTWQVPTTITVPTLNTSTQTYNIGAETGAYTFSGIASGSNPTLELFTEVTHTTLF